MSTGLWLYLRCDDRLLAIAAESIQRALLVEEAPPPQLPPLGAPSGCLGLLQMHGDRHVAWDLGVLLGLSPARRAWILLRAPHEEGPLAVALRTDDCLHVGAFPHAAALPLPAGILRLRPVFPRAFPVSDVPALHGAPTPVGFELDLDRLWTEEERTAMRDLLGCAAAEGRSEHA